MKTILTDRLERFLADDIHLIKGGGNGANGTIDVCVMQAVDWLAGGNGKNDCPDCASRSVGRFAMRLNDSLLFENHRDLLKPYAEKIVGTKASADIERQRAFIAADYAVRVFAPLWMRALGKEEWAKELEAVVPVINRVTSTAARDATRKVRADAAYAAYADDAYDAAAAAYAAAYAAAAAADAAYAADAARRTVFTSHGDQLRAAALKCLDDMIVVKMGAK